MRIMFVPDTQVKKGVDTKHIKALGNYLLEHKVDYVIHIGDNWDMPSLSTHDMPGSLEYEGRRYNEDIAAGIAALELIPKQRGVKRIFCLGNHEQRIIRATHHDPRLLGSIGIEDLKLAKLGWQQQPFLSIINIGGVRFSHYFVNPNSRLKTPVSGSMDTMLKNLGFSFAMGHAQELKFARHNLPDGTVRQGLVCGSFYSHDEKYMGVQGNKCHWRGVVLMNEVVNGAYDPCFLSLQYLTKNYL